MYCSFTHSSAQHIAPSFFSHSFLDLWWFSLVSLNSLLVSEYDFVIYGQTSVWGYSWNPAFEIYHRYLSNFSICWILKLIWSCPEVPSLNFNPVTEFGPSTSLKHDEHFSSIHLELTYVCVVRHACTEANIPFTGQQYTPCIERERNPARPGELFPLNDRCKYYSTSILSVNSEFHHASCCVSDISIDPRIYQILFRVNAGNDAKCIVGQWKGEICMMQ